MISFHPTPAQLQTFSAGSSQPAMAIMLSAHLDMCAQCQAASQRIHEVLAIEALSEEAPLSHHYTNMMSDITLLPVAESPDANTVNTEPSTLELDGRHFTLPRALRRYQSKTGNWSRLAGKLWQAPVDLGDVGKATFIYMEKGGKVPEHTHKGSELTLVIDGQYSDGVAKYDCGDFTLMDAKNKHLPHSEAEEGCLVFTIVDKPLHFTSGIARLLNPFSQLFFK
ncbi:MAG: putative transcriptional regulator [Paraglaciecola sp.]|jgi:putative transcriptional regulator